MPRKTEVEKNPLSLIPLLPKGSGGEQPNVRGPLEPHVIEKQRQKRIKELKMYAIIREIVFSFIFVWILSVFSYGNQDPYAFLTKDTYVNLLVKGDRNHTFMKVRAGGT